MVVIGLLPSLSVARENELLLTDWNRRATEGRDAHTSSDRTLPANTRVRATPSRTNAPGCSSYKAVRGELLRRRAKRVTGITRSRTESINGGEMARLAAVGRYEESGLGGVWAVVI